MLGPSITLELLLKIQSLADFEIFKLDNFIQNVISSGS